MLSRLTIRGTLKSVYEMSHASLGLIDAFHRQEVTGQTLVFDDERSNRLQFPDGSLLNAAVSLKHGN